MVEKQHSVDGVLRMRIMLDGLDRTDPKFLYLTRATRQAGKGVGRLIGFILLILVVLSPSKHAQADVTAAAVQRAIDRGVTYLRKSQNDRGGWEEFGGQSCGASALCTLALLNAGVSRDDPDMRRAIRYLRGIEPKQTYAAALQTLVFCQLGAAGDLPSIRRNVDWLVREQKTDGAKSGGWGYGGGRSGGDPSNTQFALLALGAAQDRGVEVDTQVFERSLKYWVTRQGRTGGWGYGLRSSPSGSMTCAGIASVIIARGRLAGGSSTVQGDAVECCGDTNLDEDPVAKGIDWLAKAFSVEANPGGHGGTYYYYLYALERVGRLSGRRFIGEFDWYREGAAKLLSEQDDFQGFWLGSGWEEDRNITTSFALLFLSKGKRQVVVGQLDHSDGKSRDWQKHPDGMRQLVRHVERDWGRDLTWQSIESKQASVQDLLQTPVLIISDNKALLFDAETKSRLKEYVDQGGTILFEADGGDGCGDASGFEQSVRAMCSEWFPGVQLERLPPTHPVWFAERKVDIKALPELMGDDYWVHGVQACCRTAIFYSPKSLSCRWELGDILFRRAKESKIARQKIETSVRLGQNIIAYATGRELKDKLEERVLLSGDSVLDSQRGTIRLAMLGLDAGGNEAQRALPNVAAIIRKRAQLNLVTTEKPIGFDTDSLSDVFVLWIHGRTEFEFTATQRDALREFVQNGGIIFGSSICGSDAFTGAFRKEVDQILTPGVLTPMAPTHSAFSSSFDGDDIRRVTIRKPSLDGSGQAIQRRVSHPILEAAAVDNEVIGIFLSPLDLSCALESRNSVQCPGYSTDDAAKIVANVILYALQQ